MSHPAVAELARGPELMAIARRWLGASAIPYRCTLFEKSGERNWLVVWHQDTTLPLTARNESPEWGPWSTKERILYAHAPAWALEQIIALRVHLDPSTPENGPLKVIPGSHREGVLSDAQVFEKAKRCASQDMVVGIGGVLAMHPLLIHASSKARDSRPRRVLHIEYAATLDLAPGIRVALA
jgi:ectoine hydroxylase-related dioxygenase (phytanoyl-CoA dioxygenase family)